MMSQWGFKRGRYNPCLYWHPKTKLMVTVHGDDFMSAGTRTVVKDVRTKLESRFEIKTQIVVSRGRSPTVYGGAPYQKDPEEVSVARILNLIVRCGPEGWEIEVDERHVDVIVRKLRLGDAKPVSIAGETEIRGEEEEASRFRALAARANYLSADRPDIMYSTKEMP